VTFVLAARTQGAGPGKCQLHKPAAAPRAVPTICRLIARPRQDSNLRTRLRRPMLYPLSYEGSLWRRLHVSWTWTILRLQ